MAPILALACLAGGVNFVLVAWVTPRANATIVRVAVAQTHRDNPGVPIRATRGDRELTIGELASVSSELHRERRGAAPVDTEWHKKPALAAACLSLALAGVAITRRSDLASARGLASATVLVGFYWLLRVGEQAADAGRVAPALGMWGPVLVVAALGLAGAQRRSSQTIPDIRRLSRIDVASGK